MSDSYVNDTEADSLRRENRRLKEELAKRPKRLQSHEEAIASVAAALEAAKADGHWLVAVWSQKDKMVHLRTMTTWDFDRNEYNLCLSQIQTAMRRDKEPVVDEPLPEADLTKSYEVTIPSQDKIEDIPEIE